MIFYKFVSWDVEPAQGITFESFIKNYNKHCSGVHNALNGCLKLGGWCYDFRDQLKKYLYKKDGEWRKVYAPNKTAIRQSVYGRIDEIIEL